MLNLNKMANLNIFRWAFHVPSWKPSESDMLLCSASIQKEEKDRISKFVYQEDFKSSLIGRLMMRKFVKVSTEMRYCDIFFKRDANGKPILDSQQSKNIDFNISHQGDFVVLAGHVGVMKVGIDVMNIIPPANKNIPEFFRLMNRQFSAVEWNSIRKFDSLNEELASFYRHWCLKESYVKNIGVGITVDLQSLSFNVKNSNLELGKFNHDTELCVNNKLQSGWIFEECLLDESHCVTIAINLNGEKYQLPTSYTFFDFEQLMSDATPLGEVDQEFAVNFFEKDNKKV